MVKIEIDVSESFQDKFKQALAYFNRNREASGLPPVRAADIVKALVKSWVENQLKAKAREEAEKAVERELAEL